jgi:heavy metal sensor kinase
MLRSIRWTLQFWHAAILIVAVAGIGTASFVEIRQARYREVDSELEAAAQVMLAKLHGPRLDGIPGGPPWRQVNGQGDPFGPRNGPMDTPGDGPGFPRGPGPDDQVPPDEMEPRRWHGHEGGPPDRLPRNLTMPAGFLQRYGGTPSESRSFIIYRGNKEILASFGLPLDVAKLPKYEFALNDNKLVSLRSGDLHQVLASAPEHSKILVSGSVQPINDEMRNLSWMLAGTGAGVVLLGLAGGWFFSLGAVRPIRKMTAAAEAISATHLSERIDPKAVPGELTDLARVLNAAFGRLEVAFAQQARFTADASHELRTPLTVVLSHTQLALSRDRTTEEYQKTLTTCLSASKRMKSLVDSLLLLSHADVGELALDRQAVDLSAIASDSVAMMTPLAAERGITITTEFAGAPVTGDPVRLGQLVTNLVSNAIRYNRDGGRITASTSVEENRCVLKITDTGLGISKEDQAHVFDRFFRADKARSREAGGSGLGLAICKSIVEAHEGILSVSSEPGQGSTFQVSLPFAVPNDSPMLPREPASID